MIWERSVRSAAADLLGPDVVDGEAHRDALKSWAARRNPVEAEGKRKWQENRKWILSRQ